jgi:hypothetical protein
LDETHIAQIAHGMSYATLHSLAVGTIRSHTNRGPLQPAMIAKARGNVTPGA